MNDLSQLIMSAGYIFFIASVAPNVRQVWKNRHNLRGFSRNGDTMTAAQPIVAEAINISLTIDKNRGFLYG